MLWSSECRLRSQPMASDQRQEEKAGGSCRWLAFGLLAQLPSVCCWRASMSRPGSFKKHLTVRNGGYNFHKSISSPKRIFSRSSKWRLAGTAEQVGKRQFGAMNLELWGMELKWGQAT